MIDSVKIEKNLLIIEENAEKRHLLTSYFSARYICDEADAIPEALDKLQEKEYAIVLVGLAVSSLTGISLISHLQEKSQRTVAIFISDNQETGDTVRAFRAGAFEVIQKPFSIEKVERALEKAFAKYERKCLKDSYQHHLEELVAERTAKLDKTLQEIEKSYCMLLKSLITANEARNGDARGHSERVITFSLRLGYEMKLDKETLHNLELGALLHDIGKLGIPDAILRKPAKLNAVEWGKMKIHPLHGQKILENIEFLQGAAKIIAQHHERWDGNGYPYKLRGEEIDIGARVFTVVDAFDAIVSDRVYRRGRSYKYALEELEKHSGTQFDPKVIEAFKQVPEEDWEILRKRSLTENQETNSLQMVVAELVKSQHYIEMVH